MGIELRPVILPALVVVVVVVGGATEDQVATKRGTK